MLPAATNVAIPPEIVAIDVLVDSQSAFDATSSSVVLSEYLAVAVKAGISSVDAADSVKITADKVLSIGVALTVTVQVAVNPPSSVFTVIVAVPPATPVTSPLFTVTTLGLLDDQLTPLFVALVGVIKWLSVVVLLTPISNVLLPSVTPVTLTILPLETHPAYKVVLPITV